jgi:glycosyltransferase involved in cell wall biosynthesis
MKVVFLLTQDRGGPADLTASVAGELAGRSGGPEVTVLGPAGLAGAGVPPSVLCLAQVRSKGDVKGFATVAGRLRELAPDIIHAQDRRAGLVSSLVVAPGTPVILTFHGVPDSAAGRWVQAGPLSGRRPSVTGGSRLLADALVCRRVACTVAPSAAMARFLRCELHAPERRLRVLRNGVAVPPAARIVHQTRTFATVGSFAPCKATPLLVEAFIRIAADRPDLRLLMVGDGADRRECEDLARRSGLGGQVEFTGFRADVTSQLGRADAFVLPSVNENLPLALLQAMAVGLPCIASAVGGIPELLTPGCGLLVPPGDVRSLSAALTRLADDPVLAAGLGAAARRRVMAEFSLAHCADAHIELWSGLLSRARS